MNQSKMIILVSIFVLVFMNIHAVNLKDYIFVLEPEIHSKTQETFYKIADRFKENNMEQLSDIFRSFADGGHGTGFLIKDKDGQYYIITNRHVVNHAETVNMVKHNDDGTTVKYEKCPVVYIDNEIDIAFLKFPGNKKEIAGAFELNDIELSDGDEVWSAGFPGLLGRPGWQFARGNITNRRAFVDELLDIKISHVVQHSAPIDPGNSGGPLLVKDTAAPLGYNVAGINTWQIGSRQNTNFAIPAVLIGKTLPKAKEAEHMTGNPSALKEELERNCMILAAELGSENPDWDEVKQFISYSFVGEKGWDSFLFAIKQSDKKTKELWEHSFFNISPIETMRAALYLAFWNLIRKDTEKPSVEFVDINFSDREKIGQSETIRTNFRVTKERVEIVWILEFGHWRIHYTDLDPVVGDVSGKDKGLVSGKTAEGVYPFSFNGIKMFMADLKLQNEALYEQILPDYMRLKKKDSTASIVGIGCGVIGGIAFIGGTIMCFMAINDETYFSAFDNPTFNIGIGLTIGGSLIFGISYYIAPFLGPNSDDILQFMNTHNKYSDTPLNLQR
jgi:serine protease Do